MTQAAQRLAFVCPRFAEGPTVGGAETLLKALATHAAGAGLNVTFLTTCARNHFTWANELPPGEKTVDGMAVHFFPVDGDRDLDSFIAVQNRLSRRGYVGEDDEMTWLKNSVNSSALTDYLLKNGDSFDRIIAGPYLFGLTYFAAQVFPKKTLLVPCLHDEPFAYVKAFRPLFAGIRGCLFNSEPERALARRLFNLDSVQTSVVGMGLDPFEADPRAFAARRGIAPPYVLYSGRREVLKGTPLLVDYVCAFRDRTGVDLKLVLSGAGTVDIPSPAIIDVGFLSEPEKHEAMAGALAFCHPSVNESFGIVLMESWLAGRPALVHAGSEVLRHQCRQSQGGLWFRCYADFEEELLFLLNHPDLADAMGRAGRDYVLREYSWSNVGRKLLAALA